MAESTQAARSSHQKITTPSPHVVITYHRDNYGDLQPRMSLTGSSQQVRINEDNPPPSWRVVNYSSEDDEQGEWF